MHYAFAAQSQHLVQDNNQSGRTLVVNCVANPKDAQDPPEQRCRRRILAIEKPLLDTTHSGRGRGALGQLGVKVDERAQTCALARRL